MKHILLFFIICTCIVDCRNTKGRDTISFKVSLPAMADSIKVMNSLLSTSPDFHYNIVKSDCLLIGDKKIRRFNSSFLEQIKLDTTNYTKTDVRIFSLILFLKNNEISSCYRDRALGIRVYSYKCTEDNRFEDSRDIVLNDGQLDTNSFWFRETQYIVDKKDDLLLIAPRSRKISDSVSCGK